MNPPLGYQKPIAIELYNKESPECYKVSLESVEILLVDRYIVTSVIITHKSVGKTKETL